MPKVPGPTIVYSADVTQLIRAAHEAREHVARLAKGLKDGSVSTKEFNQAVRAAKNAMSLKDKALKEARASLDKTATSTGRLTEKINVYRLGLGKLASISVVAQGVAQSIQGVYLAIDKVQSTIRRVADDANEILQSANTVGLGTEAFQEWNYVIELAGGNTGNLLEALYSLTRGMNLSVNATSRQAKIFREVGLSALDAAGVLKNREDFLLEVSDKLNELVETGQLQRMGELMGAVFGEEFAKRFGGIFAHGSERLNLLFETFREQQLGTSDETIAKLVAFRQALVRIGIQTQAVLRNIVAEDGQKFLELFQKVANLMVFIAIHHDKILTGLVIAAPIIGALVGLITLGPYGAFAGGVAGGALAKFIHSGTRGSAPVDLDEYLQFRYGFELPFGQNEETSATGRQLDFTELNRLLANLADINPEVFRLLEPSLERDTQAEINQSVETLRRFLEVVDLGARKEIERLELATEAFTGRAQSALDRLSKDTAEERVRYDSLLEAVRLLDELFRGFGTSISTVPEDLVGQLIDEWQQPVAELPERESSIRTISSEYAAALKRLDALMKSLAETAITGLSEAIVSLFESASSAADAIRSLIRQIASLSTEFLVRDLFRALGYSGDAAATGGPVRGLTMIGELGPEIVDFRRPGRVYTANELGQALGQRGDVQVSLAVNMYGQMDRNEIDQATPQLAEVVRGVVTDALSGRGDMRAAI